MITKTTYEAIAMFINISEAWVKAQEGKKTKLSYAISRVRPRADKLWAKYQNLVEDMNIDHCVVDEKGIIEKDAFGQYKFTKEGLKNRNHQRQELFENEVQIKPNFALEIPDSLTDFEHFVFEGFVLKAAEDTETSEPLSIEATA